MSVITQQCLCPVGALRARHIEGLSADDRRYMLIIGILSIRAAQLERSLNETSR